MCVTHVCLSVCLPPPAPGRDEHVQGRVLLHALRAGGVRLAHVPDAEACLWAVPPRQLLPVSTHVYTRTVVMYSASVSPDLFGPVPHASASAKWWSAETTPFYLDPLTHCADNSTLITGPTEGLFVSGCLLSYCSSSRCHLSCTSVSGSRLSQSVTVEEDNCCGCNVLAIRRHFLDRDLKQVHIVYTSCHDAVSNHTSG